MKNIFIAILFISLISCESEPGEKQSVVFPASTNNPPALVPLKNENTNTATLPVLNNTSAGALNPEHGKPGHRCDIPVGAPLNSAPANKTAAPVTTLPAQAKVTPVNVQPNAPVTTVAPGMNPQHGQPGHRCDIAVGAPLNSPPNKTAAPVTTLPAQAPATPVNVQPTAPVTTVAPGMNPQHGQPGHRCDIAVGAPLDSKPKP